MFFELSLFAFTFLISFSAFSVVTTNNPVHAVFYLILTFCLSALFLLFFQVDFLALLFIVVYVGAIAVLFLFVVMMLDLRNLGTEVQDQEIFEGSAIPLTFFVFLTFAGYLFSPLSSASAELDALYLNYLSFYKIVDNYTNIQLIGELLYTFYAPIFILGGYILLLAMLGSIMLTLKHHVNSRKQTAFIQLEKNAIFSLKKSKEIL
jgi:NADH-quinone oxidoreductase subunit J